MRIGIVTFTFHTNYGCLLQAYALQCVLNRMGHDVKHLQLSPKTPPLCPVWKLPLVWCKRIFEICISGNIGLPILTPPYKWIRKNTDAFITSYICPRYLNDDEWNSDLAKDYDAIIFGSDQIWRPIYAYPIEKFFGSFLGDSKIKRISYAPSFGTEDNEYSKEQLSLCRNLLGKFNAVSVRENSAITICKKRFGVEAKHVLDPTMLLEHEDYECIFKQVNTPKSEGTLAVYVLDENPQIDAFIKKQSSLKGLIPFRTNSKVENHNAKLSERQQPPVGCWLRAFHDAEFVITDSFHACVFSILFHKPFICIGNKNRGMSRFHSLLSDFSLYNRLVDIEDMNEYEEKEIDWSYVDKVLYEKRQESFQFLNKALQSIIR